MAALTVTFARLYGSASTRRMSQYENERIEITVTVVGSVEQAFAEARAEVEAENARREEAYAEAERERQAIYERERAERLAARLAAQEAATATKATDLPF